jgi:hypothetical protein
MNPGRPQRLEPATKLVDLLWVRNSGSTFKSGHSQDASAFWHPTTHHGVLPKHLQVYLDEFVFRHNRRRTPLAGFQTLLGLGTTHRPTTYRQITRNPLDAPTEQSG